MHVINERCRHHPTLMRGPTFARPNVFEVDLDAIAHNARAVRRWVGPNPTIFAALKADAYGYGILPVARTLLASGVNAVSLVSLGDAIALRQAGLNAPILLYAGVLPSRDVIEAVAEHRLMLTLVDLATADIVSSMTRRELDVFVKIDVGLERLGVSPVDAVEFVASLRERPKLNVRGVYAHMHVPNASVGSYVEWQFQRFVSAVGDIQAAGFEVPIAMVASTAVLEVTANRMALNAIDPGRVFFGLDQKGPGLGELSLRPALRSLKSRVIQVKAITRTEYLEVAPYPIREGMRIGIIPIGRYDGMMSLSCGQVLVHGIRANILASPSIEHSRIDLTDVPAAQVGDEVVIIGCQGDKEILPQEIAVHHGLASAGMVALAVNRTIPRVYLGQTGYSPNERDKID